MGGIRLHPKHGVNATIAQCLFCGGDKNEIALLGASYKGEAPMHMVIDDVPCDKCIERFKGNIVFFEHNGKHKTGTHAVCSMDVLDRIKDDNMRESVRKNGAALVTPEDFKKLFGGEDASS